MNERSKPPIMRQILQHKWSNGIFIPLLAGIVLGILAPFGSSNFEPVFRFTYWIGMTLAGALGAMASSTLMKRYAPDLPNSMQAIIRERLPPKFRDADLYAINSEDHYVRIHSSAGEHMILMRLSDAQDLASVIMRHKKRPSIFIERRFKL